MGTLAAKGVIRDVGRVMDLPYAFVDAIAKMIPAELNITIDKALERTRCSPRRSLCPALRGCRCSWRN